MHTNLGARVNAPPSHPCYHTRYPPPPFLSEMDRGADWWVKMQTEELDKSIQSRRDRRRSPDGTLLYQAHLPAGHHPGLLHSVQQMDEGSEEIQAGRQPAGGEAD
jgi:hypothetical protein